MKSWAQKEDILKAVLEHAGQRVPRENKTAVLSFIEAFYHNASPEDIVQRSVEMLYGAALSAWKFAAKRIPGQVKIRVFNPTIDEYGWQTSHTIVQMVNDDMPFLVDSVARNLVHDGINVHFVVHPILGVQRDAKGERIDLATPKDKTFALKESLIHLEIDTKTAPEMLAFIAAKLEAVLKDVRAAVEDWRPMLEKMEEALSSLKSSPPSIEPHKVEEAHAFLAWLKDDNFTLLGYREFDHTGPQPLPIDGTGLGILRNPDFHVFRGSEGMISMSQEISEFLQQPEPIIITKANVKSTVHRVTHMDYVGVKKFDDNGNLYGELRFVGLFTSVAYSRRPQEIPFLRKKVEQVLARSHFEPHSHDGKALGHILENFPRDELFQISDDELFATAMGILYLQERPQPKIFVRHDKFERFVSVLVFIPRELYASGLRHRIEQILCEAFAGEISTRYAQLSNDVIARWHFIIRTKPGAVLIPDLDELNAHIVEICRRWQDHLRDALIERWGEERGTMLLDKYAGAFSPVYREVFSAKIAVADIDKLEDLKSPEDVGFNFYRLAEDSDSSIRLKIYHASRIIPLSDCLPMLENLGLKVIEEFGYSLEDDGAGGLGGCIHSFYLIDPRGIDLDLPALKARLEETLTQAWSGAVENDGYNILVLRAGLSARQVVILRSYSKYLRQLGLSYSEDYLRDCLMQNAAVARHLADLFDARFNPDFADSEREPASERLISAIQAEIDDVQSLDHDRILRAYLNVVTASLRTNYYQFDAGGRPKPYLSIKIRSNEVNEAPLPRPYAEIFVYSPRVEGVHLRGGPVARGGLRWSDRREDFRTEVLGLVKAQQVKNAVIVPVGAKGGFVPKNLPQAGDREAVLAEGIACYRIFVSALLDLTDNLVDGKVVVPPRVVRRDSDDPYLVVAADKGTATFSDIANGIARNYGFWLDDAFASGGSKGYDHKKMGITARGAWVSVCRHFREMGIDPQLTPVTVVGIGDMSGDVFGNGLLSSRFMKLVAAFDHRDIFLDPDPNPALGFAERQRLFTLPRSSWRDYDQKLLSSGGGVFSRTLKSVPLSPEVQDLLDLKADRASPVEVIRAILRARADLLWIGGIGTYVKAAGQSHLDAGDRANDAVRINGEELRVKVVGEGGNLGFTQLGRVEYALNGGRLNTDAVDNSAGVDCSDHEVNIKIPLHGLVRAGKLSETQRDKLLIEMTDDVARLVLEDNYLQTQAISLAKAPGSKSLDVHRRLIVALEKEGRLNRALEFLPDEEELNERAAAKKGLTRPELSVLIAYAKMSLSDALIASPVIDDPFLEDDLIAAFPRQLSGKYGAALKTHQLRREIIATILANNVINRAGLGFVSVVRDETGASAADVVRAYLVMRSVFDLENLWRDVDLLDYRVPSAIQTLMHLDIGEFARHQTIWFVRNAPGRLSIRSLIERYHGGVEHLRAAPDEILGSFEHGVLQRKIAMYVEQGVVESLARRVANLEPLGAACDICEVADNLKAPVDLVAKAYFQVGAAVGLDWLHTNAEHFSSDDHWERLAMTAIIDDLVEQQRQLTQLVLGNGASDLAKAAEDWVKAHEPLVERSRQMIIDLHGSGQVTLAKLGFATRHIRSSFLHGAA